MFWATQFVGSVEIETGGPTVPRAFGTGDWTIADTGLGGDAILTVTGLPDDGGSALIGLFVRIGGSAPIPLGGTATGAYPLNDLFTDGVVTAVTILAENALGLGPESTAKLVTTTAPGGWSIADLSNGTFSINSTPASVAAPALTDRGDGTFDIAA